KELMPLIENRALTITISALSENQLIRVNVIPQALDGDNEVNQKIGYSNKDKIAKVPESAIKGLTTPLSLTGTAEEIDAELAQTLVNFVACHLGLQKTLDRAKEQIADAVKAIEERDKNKAKSKPATPAKPASDTDTQKTATGSLDLFDGGDPCSRSSEGQSNESNS
ncbi:MAG TPA: PRTRC system protein E, partial [Candidatus Acidoferrum sp.]|nr:PRTRC system protein E [Candidatus Acidoferrum sp.]